MIKDIEAIRAKNNKNWMDILRLALEVAPDRAKKILREINQADSEIATLLKKLVDE